jgi:hypothetical protein
MSPQQSRLSTTRAAAAPVAFSALKQTSTVLCVTVFEYEAFDADFVAIAGTCT